jgi:hypothetical protein
MQRVVQWVRGLFKIGSGSGSIRTFKAHSWIVRVVAAASLVLAGCGSGHKQENGHRNAADSVGVNAAAASRESGRIVEPAEVRSALMHTGFHIAFRRGPIPTGFADTFYGVATNSRGRSINFGFFLSSNDRTEGSGSATLRKLVPDATNEGSTAGESYIEVTSAGANRKPTDPRAGEELEIAAYLRYAVAKLAPKAFETEGP